MINEIGDIKFARTPYMKQIHVFEAMEVINASLKKEGMSLEKYIESLGSVDTPILSKTIEIKSLGVGKFETTVDNTFKALAEFFSDKMEVKCSKYMDMYINEKTLCGSMTFEKNIIIDNVVDFLDILRVSKITTKANMDTVMKLYVEREKLNIFFKFSKEYKTANICMDTITKRATRNIEIIL